MDFFNFHHHFPDISAGIYNANLYETAPEIPFSAGIHPKDIKENLEEKFNWLKEVSASENCVAIGECGLDGLLKTAEKIQESCFERQILLANELNKPIIIHCVRRFSHLLKFKKLAKTPMVIHGFNKKGNIAQDLLEHGFYLSFGKALLQNVSLQSVFEKVPAERFFLESDNADLEMKTLYQKASEIKNLSLEEIRNQIQKNLVNIRRNE